MDEPTKPKPIAPPGLQKLFDKCLKIYPDQPNPLQVTTVVKYWLGGQDPLDYISMYSNPGDKLLNIPPHWHYISFGLSDLHGDGRVHQLDPNIITSPNEPLRSGMGFELSFRLAKDYPQPAALTMQQMGLINNKMQQQHHHHHHHHQQQQQQQQSPTPQRPPTWPANLLQALARYVFRTGNRLCAGDNIPWRKSLNNQQSKIQNMLITEDAQMQRVHTPFGTVDFCQIVGVTDEELDQASRWNGNGIINLLKKDSTTGGEWLITNMLRTQSVFELFPETLQQLENDLQMEGSDLAGVNGEFTAFEIPKMKIKIDTTTTTAAAETGTETGMSNDEAFPSLVESFSKHSIKTEQNNDDDDDDDNKNIIDEFLAAAAGLLPPTNNDEQQVSQLASSPSKITTETTEQQQEDIKFMNIVTDMSLGDSLSMSCTITDLNAADYYDNGAIVGSAVGDGGGGGAGDNSNNSNATFIDGNYCGGSGNNRIGDGTDLQSQVVNLDGLLLTLEPSAAKFLQLAIRDRIRHGRHFTFKCQNRALTFVSESVSGTVVTKESPYGVLGYWIQVLITDDLVPIMIKDFQELDNDQLIVPKMFEWPEKNLKIIIDNPTKQETVLI